MGTKGTVLCDWRSCGICNIVKSGFECVAFGAPGNKGRSVQSPSPTFHRSSLSMLFRHGDGLYSSTDPSVADRFATSCLSSPYRVMVACDVVLPQNPSQNNSVCHLPPVTSVF
ncbi:hypothetical protein OG21DRAFT_1511746 [Imleria badia]|nr:hypothetical protein OG21DRAFT_1511746 [Imleria badia]